MSASEIARLREQITLEYEACKQVFEGFSATANHAFITARQENIEAYYRELTCYISPAEAMQIIVEAENGLQVLSSGNTS